MTAVPTVMIVKDVGDVSRLGNRKHGGLGWIIKDVGSIRAVKDYLFFTEDGLDER